MGVGLCKTKDPLKPVAWRFTEAALANSVIGTLPTYITTPRIGPSPVDSPTFTARD